MIPCDGKVLKFIQGNCLSKRKVPKSQWEFSGGPFAIAEAASMRKMVQFQACRERGSLGRWS